MSNVICVLVFGNRFEYSDNDFMSLLKNMNDALALEGNMWVQVIPLHISLAMLHFCIIKYTSHHEVVFHCNEINYVFFSFQIYNMVPWLLRLVPGPHKELISLWNKVIDFVKSKIEEHRADFNSSAPRDYIDCFLGEMEKVGYLN